MLKRVVAAIGLSVAVFISGASAQTAPPPEALTAAKELIAVSHAAENLKVMLPSIMKALKPAVVQGRPQIEKDYDALVPVLLGAFGARLGQLLDQIAAIYAANFTVAEMKDLITFYRGPTGQKFVSKAPAIMQQSMLAGQQFGVRIGQELRLKMIEELRKKGHDI